MKRSTVGPRNRSALAYGIAVASAALVLVADGAAAQNPPIFDVHLHAHGVADEGPPPIAICSPMPSMPRHDPARPYGETWMALMKNPPCDDPIWSPTEQAELLPQTLAFMEKHNVHGVLSGPPERVAAWSRASDRFVSGLGFQLRDGHPSVEDLRELHADGNLEVLAEVTNQYLGIAPDDPRMEPYWALAEELDLPVGIHVGTGPPGVIYLGATGYRASLHSALTMEPVLVKHPKLRVYLMHAGYPMLDDVLALLYAHPQVGAC